MTPMPTPDATDPWEAPVRPPLPRRELKRLQRRRNGPALWFMAGHLGLGAVTTGLVAWSWGTWWMLPAMFAQGVVVVFLFAPMHECTHGTAFRTRRLNKAVAAFCGVLMLRPALYFRYRHAAHHSYTQDPERDPDQVPMPDGLSGYLGEVFGMEFWPKVVGTLYRSCTGRFTGRELFFLPESERPRVCREARLMVGLYVLAAAVCAATGAWAYLLAYWLVPRVIAEPALRLVRMAEHTGMAEGADPLTNTRTTLAGPLVRLLYWNMPFHAEHHLAPSVPFHNLARLHRALPGEPERRPYVVSKGYVRAHRDIVANLGNGSGSTVPTSTSAAVAG